MGRSMKRRWIWIVLALVLFGVPIGGLLFAWLGIYDVAASRGHWQITDRFLRFAMERAVAVRAPDLPAPPKIDDHDLIRLGAGHFHSGCAYCHGAPGQAISPISLRMLPPPPDLSHHVDAWSEKELFWILKHGIKYAGMPAWPSEARDDEVWAVVAFLRKLPRLDVQAYRQLALGDVKLDRPDGRSLALRDSAEDAARACARCHGAEGRGPPSRLVPILHGQPLEMLSAALDAYASGKRHSGVMQPIASDLMPEARQKLASYYSSLTAPAVSPRSSEAVEAIERGRQIASEGLVSEQIPPCQGCHGREALPLYPRLAGQNERYLANQLRLWKRGVRSDTETSAIMSPIGEKLSEDQIDALAVYYASLPAETSPAKRAESP
jgi:cytochrome c553